MRGAQGPKSKQVAALSNSDRWFPGVWESVFYISTMPLLLSSLSLLVKIHDEPKNGSGVLVRRSVASGANQMFFLKIGQDSLKEEEGVTLCLMLEEQLWLYRKFGNFLPSGPEALTTFVGSLKLQ